MTVTKDDGDDHNSRVPNNTDRLMFWSVILVVPRVKFALTI